MNDPRTISRIGLTLLLAALALFLLASSLRARRTTVAAVPRVPSHPVLFVEGATCPDPDRAFAAGRDLEELARFRADRYAYDPRDGIRAVRRYEEAEACYREAAAHRASSRAHRAATTLIVEVNTDYAAARMNLTNAIEQRRWPAAVSEIRFLLLITEHIEKNEYVEWLRRIIGKVASRANAGF